MASKLPMSLRVVKEETIDVFNSPWEEKFKLAVKNQIIWWQTRSYWRPLMKQAKENWDAVDAIIFSEEEKKRYLEEDKFPIEIPLIFPEVKKLSGHQRSNRRDGIPVPVGAEDSPDSESAKIILKVIRQANFLDSAQSEAFMHMLVTGYPQYIYVEPPESLFDQRDVVVTLDDYDANMPDPTMNLRTGSGLNYNIRVRLMSQEEIIERYPHAEEDIKRTTGEYIHGYDTLGFNVSSVPELIDSAHDINSNYDERGLLTVIERLFFVKQKRVVFISDMNPEPVIMPGDWDDARLQEWLSSNPDYMPTQMEVKVLWVTTSTAQGALLENRPHWFQEQRMPFAMLIPPMVNKLPFAWIKHLKQSQKMGSIARTEFISSVRNSIDNLMVAKESALIDVGRTEKEKRRSGLVLINDEYAIGEAIAFPANGRANLNYSEMEMIARNDIQTNSGLAPGFGGQAGSANETAQRMTQSIDRSERSQGMWFDSFMKFDIQLHKLILDALPYLMDTTKVLRYVDEFEDVKDVPVNQPSELNQYTGKVVKWINNMSGAKYDYVVGQGDNSVSGREEEASMFNNILSQVLPRVPQEFWPEVLKYMPNNLAVKMGKQLAVQAEERAKNIAEGNVPSEAEVKVLLNLNGEDVQTNNPQLFDILRRAQVIGPDAQPQGNETSKGVVRENMKAMRAIGTKDDPNIIRGE